MATTAFYRGFQLQKVLTHELSCEAVYDGHKYLFSRKILALRGVLSPSASAYTAERGSLTYTPGRMGASTLADIQHHLEQPQGQFRLVMGGTTVIKAPEAGHVCDADLGPKVHHVRLVEAFGERTILVEMVIEVCVNDCPDDSKRVVLSNMWEMDEEIALPNFLSERTVRGHCICHGGRLRAANLVADDFRLALSHPILPGYQRQAIQIHTDLGGNRIDYSFLDKQLPINYHQDLARLVSKVEAVHHVAVVRPQLEEVLGSMGVAAGAPLGTALRTGLTTGAGGMLRIAGSLLNLGITYLNLIPRNEHTISIRVWGNKGSTKRTLEDVAHNIALSSMMRVQTFGSVWGGFGLACMYDLMGKMVEFQLKWTAGMDRVFNSAIAGVFQGLFPTNIQSIQGAATPQDGLAALQGPLGIPSLLLMRQHRENMRRLQQQLQQQQQNQQQNPGGVLPDAESGLRQILLDAPNGRQEDVITPPLTPFFRAGSSQSRLGGMLVDSGHSSVVNNPGPEYDGRVRARVERLFSQALAEECALPASPERPDNVNEANLQ